MANLLEYAERISNFKVKLDELRRAELTIWEMEYLSEFVAFAIQNLSPLQVGDTAELVKTLDIKEDSGWWSDKHFLVVGYKGIVREVGWAKGKFTYLWEPVNQTYIINGQEKPVIAAGLFHMNVDNLTKSLGPYDLKASPKGEYGVYCEARGHMGNPGWLNQKKMSYEEAVKEADSMCRGNHQWHYYAKPVN